MHEELTEEIKNDPKKWYEGIQLRIKVLSLRFLI